MRILPNLVAACACMVVFLCGCKNEAQNNLEQSVSIAEAKSMWIAGPACKLFVDRGGSDGLPVILIHSLAGNTTQWQPQLQHLRKSRFAAAFDMRGHGQSEPARDHDYALEAMARDVATIVDSLGLPKVVLIGHSYGGGVIATYAGRYPEKVAGLLFVDPIGDIRNFPKEEVDKWMSAMQSEAYDQAIAAHWRSILISADSAVAKTVMSSLQQTPKEVVVQALASMIAFNPAAVLRPYRGPMQSIVSGLPDDPSALHHVIANLPHVVMPGTSHWLQMDQPEEFNRLMDEFLNKLEGMKNGDRAP